MPGDPGRTRYVCLSDQTVEGREKPGITRNCMRFVKRNGVRARRTMWTAWIQFPLH